MGALFLALLELTFVMVSLMLFHGLKRTIGSSPFYLSLGMFFVLGQIVSSANLMVDPGLSGFRVNLGHTTLLAPYLAALLIVYVVDGTLEAQRLILGFVALLFGYYYLASVIASQCAWSTWITLGDDNSRYLQAVLQQSKRTVFATFVAQAVDLVVLPILFQFFHNRRSRLFFSVLGTLVLTQVIDSFLYQIIAYPELEEWWNQLRTSYLARAGGLIWLSGLTTVYLHMFPIEESGERRPLDIVLDFLGGYGRTRELQKSLREWEGRYRIVVQSSSDLIFIADHQGKVLNANPAALRALGLRPGQEFSIQDTARRQDDIPCDWAALWMDLQRGGPNAILHQDWKAITTAGDTIELDASISRGELREAPVAVVSARDVTARRRLEREHRQLEEQLVHAQRMQAVGQLAGGVAHDFNNLLHTIRGSIDGLSKQWELSAPSRAMVSNIDEAASRATELTAQLLGFARRGKYRMERYDVAEIVDKARSLFEPVAGRDILLKTIVAPDAMIVCGDSTQLQQVFLNLLLNARDAIHEKDAPGGRIVFRAEVAAEHTPGWQFRDQPEADPRRYVCVRVRDNGIGMTPEIQRSIFDPFFTTKGVGKGTGMGLAMAYGCVGNHHGWIHVESERGKGSEFFLFLPRL
ncbi:MAG: PAS domain S-box protein [Lentisphaeria bacterium]|nr:PAS domain S-box protein [Lentisphaeria bacterium]